MATLEAPFMLNDTDGIIGCPLCKSKNINSHVLSIKTEGEGNDYYDWRIRVNFVCHGCQENSGNEPDFSLNLYGKDSVTYMQTRAEKVGWVTPVTKVEG